MHLLRTRFASDIVAEFLPPAKRSRDVVILCSGMPGYPAKREVVRFFAKKNFWVFSLRYRGTWESSGSFLARSPHEDVLDLISELPLGFVDLWNQEEYRVQPEKIYVIGASFGGPAAILASRDERVTAAVAVSSVIDWKVKSPEEPMDVLHSFVRDAFGQAYRFDDADWSKLESGDFYNPASVADTFDGNKLFFIHAADDLIAPIEPLDLFIEKTNAYSRIIKKGGHMGLSYVTRMIPYYRMRHFFYTSEKKRNG